MRFSTVVISSAFVLAGMSAAQFAGSDLCVTPNFFIFSHHSEFEARAFDEEPELYARGGAISRLTGGNRNPPSYRAASRDPPPRYTAGDEQMAPPHVRAAWNSNQRPADYSNNHKTPAYTSTSQHRHRRSYYYDGKHCNGLVARGNTPSRMGGGDKERKDGKPPKYKVAANDPPPRYQGSPNHVPHLDSFRTETDYSHNHKSPSGTQAHRHRRSFYDLD
ncbi:hypothetical protein M378DRAFT_132848 [Amanita muscaria Koide BX008]|uniref:Uncharacterized protein n=1 Tax=Amanita muscaria (strain Koide BX008) TaxID=946122 RepID=A0A0C2SVI8_AMAMK|nr:hypothetical protein M378DRAFT_132848 [Amanita muscaria Koide BX008]